MQQFSFQAKTLNGLIIQGNIDAPSEAEVRIRLRSQQMTPIKIENYDTSSIGGCSPYINTKTLYIFTNQFTTLIESKIPVVQALDVLIKEQQNLSFKKVLQNIRSHVSNGKKIAASMEMHPNIFDKLYISLINYGEEHKILDKALLKLTSYLNKKSKINSKLTGAIFYPTIVFCIASIIITTTMIVVIPRFKEMFELSGKKLPAITEFVIHLSQIFTSFWHIVFFVLTGTIIILVQSYKIEYYRQYYDSTFIRLPIFGILIQKAAIAKFSRIMETLLSSGVGISDSLEISSTFVGNSIIKATISQAKNAVEKGKSLSEFLLREKFIPNLVSQMIDVGEQTGKLDIMFEKVADFYENEVDLAITEIISVIEPILMVLIGGMIGGLIIAMCLPIFNLGTIQK